jgi:hypothetical protein
MDIVPVLLSFGPEGLLNCNLFLDGSDMLQFPGSSFVDNLLLFQITSIGTGHSNQSPAGAIVLMTERPI